MLPALRVIFAIASACLVSAQYFYTKVGKSGKLGGFFSRKYISVKEG